MKKRILGLKITAPKSIIKNDGKKTTLSPVIGWSLIEAEVKPNIKYGKLDNLTHEEKMKAGRKVIGEFVVERMQTLNLDVTELSKLSSLSNAQINDIINGNSSYSFDSFMALTGALNCYLYLCDKSDNFFKE